MIGLSPNFWYKYQFPAYFTVIYAFFLGFLGFPCGSAGKESAGNVGDLGSIPTGKIPWGRTWQPTPVLLPGNSTERGAGQAAAMESQRVGDDSAANFHFHFHAFFWEF